MICQRKINDLELPLPLVDGKHFVTFKDKLYRLIDKIDFFLKNKQLKRNGYRFRMVEKVLKNIILQKDMVELLMSKIFN